MKKIKLSLVVVSAIAVASLTAFAPKSAKIVAGWYGQTSNAVPPYNTSFPINASNLNAKCPVATQHLCAAYLKSDGTLDPNQSPNTRMSSHNFQP